MTGGTKVIQPSAAPAPPSVSQSVSDYTNSLPQIYQASLQYDPQFAAQEYGLQAEYAPQYAKLYRDANAAAYPETAGLQEKLAAQASAGIDSPLPDYLKKQYLDQLHSEVGDNAGSGIAGDYVSTNLLNLGKSYQDYYRNLAFSLSGNLPLTTAQPQNLPQVGAGYNYANTSNFTQGTYAPYAGAYANIANSANAANSSNYKSKLALYGTAIGSGSSFLSSFNKGGG